MNIHIYQGLNESCERVCRIFLEKKNHAISENWKYSIILHVYKLFVSLKKQVKRYCSLIYRKRKILFVRRKSTMYEPTVQKLFLVVFSGGMAASNPPAGGV
jgi:hypothetical protein